MITRRILAATVSAVLLVAPTGLTAPLPSSEIEHPAVLHMVTDRRLDVDPERTERLVAQAMAFSDDQLAELILPMHGFTDKLVCPACGCQVTDFSLDDPEQITCPECGTAITADSGSSLRAFFPPQDGSEVTLGLSPTIRRAMQDTRKGDDYQGPHLLVEHDGPDNLFAVVYDCWLPDAEQAVRSVAWERLGDSADAPLAVPVKPPGGREDLIYCSLDRQPRSVGDVTLAGAWAVLRREAGHPSWAWTHNGAVDADGRWP